MVDATPVYVPPLMPFVIERIKNEKPIPPSIIKYLRDNNISENATYNGKWKNFEVYSENHHCGAVLPNEYCIYNVAVFLYKDGRIKKIITNWNEQAKIYKEIKK